MNENDKIVGDDSLSSRQKTVGILEIMPDGHGFLRSINNNYGISNEDTYVNQSKIKTLNLRTGDYISGISIPGKGKFLSLEFIEHVNGFDISYLKNRPIFEKLIPIYPFEKFNLNKSLSCRLIDIFSPIGKGQRGLIVAQPKTGKTMLLKDIANSITKNHPETHMIILLIDERPEEVTDISRNVNAEVISSTFDEPADKHIRVSNIVLERAKRLVENGKDVVILLDSITRLSRAFNTAAPSSGKILTGGIDANALQKPKRFFGSARKIENGGSLTIIATALVETGSRMDDIIFEEFKGTGNMELLLDRKISEKRIFPSINITSSGTRRDDMLLDSGISQRIGMLRNHLTDMTSVEAMNFMKDRISKCSSNEEFFISMNS